MRALGEAVAHLPWLAPCAASLLTLARAPAQAAWAQMRCDPGAMLLVVRQTTASLAAGPGALSPALLRDPALLDGALHFLAMRCTDQPTPDFVDWSQPALAPIYETS